jgi:hypothetical protein
MLEDALTGLSRQLHRCDENLTVVRLCIREDRPGAEHGDHKLVQDIDDAVADLIGEVGEAGAAAETAARASRRSDVAMAVRALERVSRHSIAADRRLRDDILGRSLPQLRRISRVWGPDWDAWAGVIGSGLLDARAAADAVADSTVTAWATVADRSGPAPVTPSREAQPR